MSNYKGHVAGAAVAGVTYALAVQLFPGNQLDSARTLMDNWQTLAGLLVVAMLFGLWPDVDTNSKAQDLYIGLAFVSDILLIITGNIEAAAYLGLIAMTPIVGKHRGWTHSRIAMLLVPLPLVIIPWLYRSDLLPFGLLFYGAAVAGYFSHLLLDGLIIHGIGHRTKRW